MSTLELRSRSVEAEHMCHCPLTDTTTRFVGESMLRSPVTSTSVSMNITSLLWGLVLLATLGPLHLCKLFCAFNYVEKISPPAWLEHRISGKAYKCSRIHSYVMNIKESGQETRHVTKCAPVRHTAMQCEG